MSKIVTGCLTEEAKAYYRTHCYEFVCTQIVHSVWPKYRPTWQQKEIYDAISIYNRVGVASGHGVGKDGSLACIAIWFLETRPSPSRVYATSPTSKQMKKGLWPYINRWLQMSYVKDDFEWLATEIKQLEDPIDRFATYVASKDYGNIQGVHADHLLWILNEAFSIPNHEIWQTIAGSLTQEDNKLIFCGNYTVAAGPAHEAFDKDRALWVPENKRKLLTFSSEDSPIVEPEYVREMETKWGRDHDVFRTRVLGLPPKGNPDAYLKREDVVKAANREIEDPTGDIIIGIDCARKGRDLTVFSPWLGKQGLSLITMPKSDEVQIRDKCIEIVRDLRKDYNIPITKKIYIKIDNTGGYGSGAYDLLVRNTTDNLEIIGISFSGGGDDECYNATSIMYKDLKEELGEIELPDDKDLIDELATRNFTYRAQDGKDKLLIESKEDYKRRNNGVSPDRADAVIIARTKNAAPKKVWSFFPSEFVVDIKANWQTMEDFKVPLISLWISESMILSGIVGLWNSHTRKLFILADFATENPHAEVVVPRLKGIIHRITAGQVTDFNKFEVFGNKVFFSNNGGDIRNAYLRHNLNVRENIRFNEPGAIVEVERLIRSKSMYVDRTVEFLPYDLVEWTYKSGVPEKGYGLCRSLCNIASALYEGYVGVVEKKLKAYGKEKHEIRERIQKNAQERGVYDSSIATTGDKYGYLL